MSESFKSFEELEAWKKGREIRKEVSVLTRKFPPDEKDLLKKQIIGSSRSITANIAEGFGRFHFKENAQHSRISRGSLMETLDHLYVALDEGYISAKEFENMKLRIDDCNRILNGYISYLVNCSKNFNKPLETYGNNE